MGWRGRCRYARIAVPWTRHPASVAGAAGAVTNDSSRLRRAALPLLSSLLLLAPGAGSAVAQQLPMDAARGLASLSLEQLGDVVVTSASRREESLAAAAASIFVITAEDIRRSGAHSLPELLRLAPNLDVARAGTNQYAISARGFNSLYANRMLVLIDGRTVYSPLLSGVLWDETDLALQDIERIEVLSGPGATLWGANAVNGVINIITRPSSDTQGLLIGAAVGNLERHAVARHGGTAGETGSYRLYARAAERDPTRGDAGSAPTDGSESTLIGFRADWQGGRDGLTVQGDAYDSTTDQQPAPRRMTGNNLLARWTHRLPSGSHYHFQAYHDHRERRQPEASAEFHDRLETYDVEFQYAFRHGTAHRIVWGVGHRSTRDRSRAGSTSSFVPAERMLRWSTAFLQDEIALRPNLALTFGAKIETNSYTAAEILPSLRLGWRPAPDHLLWGALSRAVRAPSRVDRDYFSPALEPVIRGGPAFVSEISKVAELGYRARLSPSLTLSATAFHHDHDRLRSVEPGPEGGRVFANGLEGHTTGIEGWARVQVLPHWRLIGGGTRLDQSLRVGPGANELIGVRALGNDAGHWWSIRSLLDLTSHVGLDTTVRRVGARPDPAVPAYTAVDLRLGWQASRHVNLSLVVRNLLDPGHPEWRTARGWVEQQRSVFLRLLWRE